MDFLRKPRKRSLGLSLKNILEPGQGTNFKILLIFFGVHLVAASLVDDYFLGGLYGSIQIMGIENRHHLIRVPVENHDMVKGLGPVKNIKKQVFSKKA